MNPQPGHVSDHLIAESPASSCHYGNLAILSGHHWQRQKGTHRYQGEYHLIRRLLQDRQLFQDMTQPCTQTWRWSAKLCKFLSCCIKHFCHFHTECGKLWFLIFLFCYLQNWLQEYAERSRYPASMLIKWLSLYISQQGHCMGGGGL